MKKHILIGALICATSLLSAQSWQINYFDYSSPLTPGFNVLLPDSTNQLWQVGKSAKFDGIISTKPALYTDTLNSYPVNVNESVTMALYAESPINGEPAHWYDIRFTHRFETDSLMDGGYVEISLDSGLTWVNAIDYLDSVPWPAFSYNCDFSSNTYLPNGNRCAFTGDGLAYRQSTIFLGFMASISPSTPEWNGYWPIAPYVRFSFSSDSIQSNKAGWQIDDVEIIGMITSDVEERANPIFISPNPSNGVFKIESLNHHESHFVVLDAGGRIILDDNMSGTSTQIDLSLQPAGNYIVHFEDGFSIKLIKQ